MARVPHSEREEIVKLSLEGYSQRNIASLSGRPLKTVNRIVRAYRDEGRIKDAPQDRRPRSTTIDQDLMIVAAVNDDPFQNANSVRTALELDVSDTTVRRRLREAGMQSRVAAQKPLLTPSNKTVRLKFANDYRSWTVNEWKCVVFSDESTFSTHSHQQQGVWRTECTRYRPENVKEVATSGRTSVNVWAALSCNGLGPLVRINEKINNAAYCNTLDHDMIPYVLNGPWPDGCYLFQHDLSPVYMAKVVTNLLDQRGVMRLLWCPKGVDLNIIEPVWGRMKANISKLSLDTVNADELWRAIPEEWERLQSDSTFVDALYASLPSRMECVIQAGSAMTRY
ncbi:hypothetical protein ISCGN_007444 [Ixodes scapularis]